jgi:hypothetical protein
LQELRSTYKVNRDTSPDWSGMLPQRECSNAGRATQLSSSFCFALKEKGNKAGRKKRGTINERNYRITMLPGISPLKLLTASSTKGVGLFL